MDVHATYRNDTVTVRQFKYPKKVYRAETRTHAAAVNEYRDEIHAALCAAQAQARPNMKLYANQPHANAMVRHKLVDFTLKMSERLKIVPFVFCRAVRLFDRYCSKRVVLLDQAQLIVTTCLWIAAKVHGGNNHFANMATDRKARGVASISDLGYGCGARFRGPTERYRLPKLKELVQLCGTRCNYDANMFVQMELHIMAALEWQLHDPSFDDFMVASPELKVAADDLFEEKLAEFHRTKRFMAYAACYSYDLVRYDPQAVAHAIVDLVNSTFQLSPHDPRFQRPNYADPHLAAKSPERADVRHAVARAVGSAPPFLLSCFPSVGPQSMHRFMAAASPPPAPSPTAPRSAPRSAANSPCSDIAFSPNSASAGAPFARAASPSPGYSYKNQKLAKELHPKNAYTFDGLGQSHHYPPLHPPSCKFYPRRTDSHSSLRSFASPKEVDIFDTDRPKQGLPTPSSSDDDCKGKRF